MKQAAYVSGVLGLLTFILGAAFKLHHIEGASLLISWSPLFNEIIVLPVIAFYVLRSNSQNKSINLLSILSIFILIAGLYFKVQHWPASLEVSILGVILFCISTILFANRLYKRDVEQQNI